MRTPKRTWGALLLVGALLTGGAWTLLGSQQTQQKEQAKPEAAQTSKKKQASKKKSQAGAEPGREISPREVLSRVLRSYKTGFESLSPSAVRSSIDAQRFYDYPRFEEGVTVFLRSLGELRLFTREVNVQVEGDKAVMIVAAEMVFSRRGTTSPSQTRAGEITFDFQRTSQGWKITEINPRSFFLP